jgi:hypothetical protein
VISTQESKITATIDKTYQVGIEVTTQTPTQEPIDYYHKATKISSLYGAAELRWTADGKIICRTCILNDGTSVPWGEIDPSTGHFLMLSPKEFQIPEQISDSNIFKDDEILLYLPSPSKEKAILSIEEKIEKDHSLVVYSMIEETATQIPFSLDFCEAGGIYSLQEWSGDSRYVLASCWMANVGETLTWFIINTNDGTIYDLREAIGTSDGVTAVFSSDGKKVAATDYRNSIYVYLISELFSGGKDQIRESQIIEIETMFIDRMKWSMDDRFIYFDSHRKGEILLCRVDLFTGNTEIIFDRSKIETIDNHILPFFHGSWYLSPDNQYILLNHYTLLGDNTLWLFHLTSR